MKCAMKFRVSLAKLRRSTEGGVLIMVTCGLVLMILAVGIAIDFSHEYTLKSRLGSAIDAAGIAVGTGMGACSTTPQSVLISCMDQIAQQYFNANFPANFAGTGPVTVHTSISSDSSTITVSANTVMATSFMEMFGVNTIPVSIFARIRRPCLGGGVGCVYVSDTTNNRVEVFDFNGNYLSQFGNNGTGTGQFDTTRGLHLDPSAGNIYVADLNNRVQKLTNSGHYITQFGSPGNGNGQFSTQQTGLTVDLLNGNIWVADLKNSRIQAFDKNNVFLNAFGFFDFTPYGLAVDGNSNIWVADNSANRVDEFSPTGTLLRTLGTPPGGTSAPGEFDGVGGVAVDASGNIWATDVNNGRIQEYGSDGTYKFSFGSPGTGPGQFDHPFGITCDSGGNLWISEWYGKRIQKCTPAGVCQAFGTVGTGPGQFGTTAPQSGPLYITTNSLVPPGCTIPPAAPINGLCGAAQVLCGTGTGQSHTCPAGAYGLNNCAAGVAAPQWSLTTDPNPSTWTCLGLNGGTNATCPSLCPAANETWVINGLTCSGNLSSVISGQSSTATSTNGNNGSATYDCSNSGTWTGPTTATCTPPPSCGSMPETWIVNGVSCSGTLSGVAGGKSSTATSTNGNNGSATYDCSNTGNWTGPTSSTCSAPPGCGSTSETWNVNGVSCSGTLNGVASGQSSSTTSTNGNTGTANYTCNNGSWVGPNPGDTCSAPPGCGSTTETWNANGAVCSGPLNGVASGQSSTANSNNGNNGAAIYTCNDGNWNGPVSSTCTQAPPPPQCSDSPDACNSGSAGGYSDPGCGAAATWSCSNGITNVGCSLTDTWSCTSPPSGDGGGDGGGGGGDGGGDSGD